MKTTLGGEPKDQFQIEGSCCILSVEEVVDAATYGLTRKLSSCLFTDASASSGGAQFSIYELKGIGGMVGTSEYEELLSRFDGDVFSEKLERSGRRNNAMPFAKWHVP
jgi:hypothetical protein